MIDRQIRSLLNPVLIGLASNVAKLGITPNQLTIGGLLIGLSAAVSVAFQLYLLGFVLILLSRLADGLDGDLARLTGKVSDRGGFLDITFDLIFYSSIIFGFAVSQPAENALPAVFLTWSFLATGTALLSYASVAEKRGLSAEERKGKTLLYIGGLLEGFETIAFLCIICLLPQYFPILAWSFAGLTWVTAAMRIYKGWVDFKD